MFSDSAFGYKFSGAKPVRAISRCIVIGVCCATLAGELTPNLIASIVSVLADSAGAFAGWMLVGSVRRVTA